MLNSLYFGRAEILFYYETCQIMVDPYQLTFQMNFKEENLFKTVIEIWVTQSKLTRWIAFRTVQLCLRSAYIDTSLQNTMLGLALLNLRTCRRGVKTPWTRFFITLESLELLRWGFGPGNKTSLGTFSSQPKTLCSFCACANTVFTRKSAYARIIVLKGGAHLWIT